jgi:hypothetical protein
MMDFVRSPDGFILLFLEELGPNNGRFWWCCAPRMRNGAPPPFRAVDCYVSLTFLRCQMECGELVYPGDPFTVDALRAHDTMRASRTCCGRDDFWQEVVRPCMRQQTRP